MKWMLLASCLLYNFVSFSETRSATASERIYTDVLNGYQLTNPIMYRNDSLEIAVGFQLYQVESLDGKSQVLETSGCLTLLWIDPRLSWDSSNYDGLGILTIEASNIWVPRIGLKNSFRKLNMFSFPYDWQDCALDFGNILKPAELVNISTAIAAVDLQSFYQSSEFIVDPRPVTRLEYEIEGAAFTYTNVELQFWIRLHRRPFFYVLNIIIPAIVLAILSTLTFMVPTDSGEQLSLGVSILLAFSVFMLILSENTPQTSENPPILALYLTITVTICGANILIQMMLMNMHYVTPIRPVPRWLQIVRGILSCRFSRHRGDVDPTNGPKDPELDAGVAVDKVDANNFDMDSALLKEILVLSEKVKSDEKENAMAEEWKEIANLLDRLLFYIFIVYQVAMAIVCFGIVPAMQPKPDSDAV